jgi:HlyD family secretion protein
MLRLLRNPRVLIGALLVGALVAVAVWPRAAEVDTAVVTRGPLVVTIDEDGETRVRDRFVVTAPVGGEVLRIELEPGDPVKRGARLATVRAAAPVPLDARTRAEAQATVGSAEAAVGRLRAERSRAATVRDRARQQIERTRTLADAGALPREEFEARDAELKAAEDAVRSAEFAVAQAEQELEAARARLAPPASSGAGREYVITAPVDGVILRRHRESQSVVPAGEPLLEIGNPNALEIVADLLSADAVKIAPGAEVLIDQWGGAEVLRGRVRRIEPSAFTKISALGVEEQRVNVIIEFEDGTESAKVLGDNYRVEVRIVLWRADAVLKAPPGSLFRQGDGWAMYRVADGRAVLAPVVIGQRSDTEAQILSGIDEGATVVVYPPDTLKDGDKVAPRAEV